MAYRNEVLADNPVAYWPLGEESGTVAKDVVGTNHGTYEGTVVRVTSILPNESGVKCPDFNGTNTKVRIPPTAALAINGAWTVEAWFVIDDVSVKRGIFAEKYTGAGNPVHYWLGADEISGARVWNTGGYYTGSAWKWAGTNSVPPTGVLCYAAVRFDPSGAGEVRHYFRRNDNPTLVNGGTNTTNTAGLASAVEDLLIGCKWDETGLWDGRIAHVALYPSALSDARMDAHWNAGRVAGTGPATNTAPVAGLTLAASGLTVTATSTSTDAEDPGGVPAQIHYDFINGGAGPWVTSNQHTYPTTGTKTVWIRATDSGGLTSTANRSIALNTPPVAGLTLSADRLTVTATSTSTDAEDSGGIPAQVHFDFVNNGAGPWVSSNQHTYATFGLKTVWIRATDFGGLTSTASATIELKLTASVAYNACDSVATISIVESPPPPAGSTYTLRYARHTVGFDPTTATWHPIATNATNGYQWNVSNVPIDVPLIIDVVRN